jgi:hypothetical protein
MLRLTLLCIALAVSTAAQAATVVWSANINGFDMFNGADVAVGGLVRLGTFNLTDSEITQNAQNVPFLESHFTEFGSTTIGSGGAPAGHFSTTTNNNSATAVTLAGSQIYVWAFSSGTVANSTEHGIFYMPKATDADWQFPAQVPLPGSTQIELANLTDATSTSLLGAAKTLVGTFGPGTSATTGKPNFTLQPVPEPASAMLLMVSGCIFGCFRRRRQS